MTKQISENAKGKLRMRHIYDKSFIDDNILQARKQKKK